MPRCKICLDHLNNNASKRTDEVYLRTINGRDEFVCGFHKEDQRADREQNSKGVVQGHILRTGELDSTTLPN